jgi:hypothetical protein
MTTHAIQARPADNIKMVEICSVKISPSVANRGEFRTWRTASEGGPYKCVGTRTDLKVGHHKPGNQIPRCARDDNAFYRLPRWGRAVLDPYKGILLHVGYVEVADVDEVAG